MSGPRLNAAYYAAPVAEFLRAAESEVYAPLASPHGYTLAPEQLSAWYSSFIGLPNSQACGCSALSQRRKSCQRP